MNLLSRFIKERGEKEPCFRQRFKFEWKILFPFVKLTGDAAGANGRSVDEIVDELIPDEILQDYARSMDKGLGVTGSFAAILMKRVFAGVEDPQMKMDVYRYWYARQPKTRLSWKDARSEMGLTSTSSSSDVLKKLVSSGTAGLTIPKHDHIEQELLDKVLSALRKLYDEHLVYVRSADLVQDRISINELIQHQDLDAGLWAWDKIHDSEGRWELLILEESYYTLIGCNDPDLASHLEEQGLELETN
jgi:hypothetical protein